MWIVMLIPTALGGRRYGSVSALRWLRKTRPATLRRKRYIDSPSMRGPQSKVKANCVAHLKATVSARASVSRVRVFAARKGLVDIHVYNETFLSTLFMKEKYTPGHLFNDDLIFCVADAIYNSRQRRQPAQQVQMIARDNYALISLSVFDCVVSR